MTIKFGDKNLRSNVILAPMAGVTDFPFRKIVREFGDFLVFSEMVASQAMIRHVQRTHKMIEGACDEYTAVQIVGADPCVMAQAAKISVDLGAKFIDINMGCPVRKIVQTESGSALMKQVKLATMIMESVVNSVSVPVSVKIRLGWDMEQKNAPEIAKIAENSGIKMISVHGRTRSQLYSGKADWVAVKCVKNAVKIPVIVNGDIVNIDSAQKALDESSADGVMIGRGAIGAPWKLLEIHNYFQKNNVLLAISKEQKFQILLKHVDSVLKFYATETATKLCRKVFMSYCKGFENAAQYRCAINSIETLQDIDILFKNIREDFLSD